MPLYEYVCQDCESQAELLVQGSQQPLCPKCGSAKLTKLLSVVAAPGRDTSAGSLPNAAAGSCGPSCGCHPH
jgi:putative FmdB family regulatory protein